MNTTIWLLCIAGAYLLGSIPLSYLAGKARGVDLRKHGTRQVGGGNLWRMTSRKLGFAVGFWDFLKGGLVVIAAWLFDLDAGQQLVVGVAVITGHNWPVFLKFHGGRGIATLLGIVVVHWWLNDLSPLPAIISTGFVVLMTVIFRSSPLPVLISTASLSVVSWLTGAGWPVASGYVAILLVVIIKRLTAQATPEGLKISTGRLLVNRFFFDRDIADKTAWVKRKLDVEKELHDDQSAVG